MPGAFDSESYQQQYGPALSQIAGFNAVSGAGGVDATDPDTGGSTIGADYDQDQERNIMAANNANPGAAPLPSPFQQERAMERVQPPAPAKGGDKGALSPGSSGGFFDPHGPQASAPVYHAVDQLSDEQAKALDDHHSEGLAAGKDKHGVPDLQTLHDKTFTDQLKLRVQNAGLDEETASKALTPTWRDKLSMMLDAANRASIIQGQNPSLSKGQAWSLATREALDGWMAHAQGQHDGYMQQQEAFRQQAEKDADAAVKRAGDQFGLQQKADQLLLAKRKQDEVERKNKADEDIKRLEAKGKVTKEEREAKGDLVTLDSDAEVDGKVLPKGSMVRIDAAGKPHATGVSGTKAGTKAPGAGEATTERKNAETALDKIRTSIEKSEAAKAKDPMNFGQKQATPEEIEARAMEMLRTTDPKSYKALKGDDIGAPAPAATPKGGAAPSWYKQPQS